MEQLRDCKSCACLPYQVVVDDFVVDNDNPDLASELSHHEDNLHCQLTGQSPSRSIVEKQSFLFLATSITCLSHCIYVFVLNCKQ